jgi:hypothetical protein
MMQPMRASLSDESIRQELMARTNKDIADALVQRHLATLRR